MKCIYIAGPYSANNVLNVLENMRRGIRISTEVMLHGFAPFCPWLDYQFVLALRDGETLEIDDFYNYSLAWLNKSDAMLVLPNYENSKGTLMEIQFATTKHIPIYFSLKSLIQGEK